MNRMMRSGFRMMRSRRTPGEGRDCFSLSFPGSVVAPLVDSWRYPAALLPSTGTARLLPCNSASSVAFLEPVLAPSRLIQQLAHARSACFNGVRQHALSHQAMQGFGPSLRKRGSFGPVLTQLLLSPSNRLWTTVVATPWRAPQLQWWPLTTAQAALPSLMLPSALAHSSPRKPNTRGPICKRQNPCLLYTSPSPRDRQKSRMPSSA